MRIVLGVVKGSCWVIISKQGVRVELEMIRAIQSIELPRTKKELQSFFGKVIFMRRFIPNIVEITKLLNRLLRNDAIVKWDYVGHATFHDIKQAIVNALVLVNPKISKEFLIIFIYF